MKKIKSVIKNGVKFLRSQNELWYSTGATLSGFIEFIPEDVIRNCPLFEVEYEPERLRAERNHEYYYLGNAIQVLTERETDAMSDRYRHIANNYFQTREQAERAAAHIKKALDEFWAKELNK